MDTKNRPIPIHKNSNLASRFKGFKQKNMYPSSSMPFLGAKLEF